MAWFTILMSTAGSAAIASAITIIVSRMEAHKAGDDEAPLSSLIVCSQLEVYGAACAEIVLEDLGYARSNGKIGALAQRLAPAPEFSPDIRWKALGVETAGELFNFRAQVGAAQRVVATLARGDDGDAISRECIRQSIGLGLRAYAIARLLRSRHALPAADSGADWDPAAALAKWHLELAPTTRHEQAATLRNNDRQDGIEAQWADSEAPPFILASDVDYEEPSTHPLFRDAR
jgi:hypothetical protein